MNMKSSRFDHQRSPHQSQLLSSTDGNGEDQEFEKGCLKTRIPQRTHLAAIQHRTFPRKAPGGDIYETTRPRSATTRLPPAHPAQLLQGMRQARPTKDRPALKVVSCSRAEWGAAVSHARAVSECGRVDPRAGDIASLMHVYPLLDHRPSNLAKNTLPPFRPSAPVIKVPLSSSPTNITGRENQDTDVSVCSHTDHCDDSKRGESNSSSEDKKRMELKKNWQKDITMFENIKRQLNQKQRDLLELYATLRSSHKQLLDMGQTMSLPPSDELKIMKVAKLTPEQLLQLCDVTEVGGIPNLPDLHTLRELPNIIVATCEKSLNSRKELITWFEDIVAHKMITRNVLVKKIKQFKTENEEIKKSLDKNKEDYMRFFIDADNSFKKGAKNTTYQLSFQYFLFKLSEANALKNKLLVMEEQIIAAENKSKELEKQLKDEQHRKRDRFSRPDAQCKSREEKLAQLTAALDEADSKYQALEETVCQLRDENEKMQSSYDQKIQKINESVDINTQLFEEITADRSKLLCEKQDLENQIMELRKNFEETLSDTRHESNSIVAKLIEAEKKYKEALEEKNKLADKVESMCAQLLDSELRYKEASAKATEAELTSRELAESHNEIELLKCQLENAKEEALDYQKIAAKQQEAMTELRQNWNNAVMSVDLMKNDLNSKEIYILELERKLTALEQRLLDSQLTTKSYEEEISNVQNKIALLRELFGGLQSFEELHEAINHQFIALKEANLQKDTLTEALKEKDIELQQVVVTLTEQKQFLEDRESALKMLTDKTEEQNNVITLLRNNLDDRTQADIEINRQIDEKNAEIESLISNVEKRKQQILQLEKIILTLEDQIAKLSNQKRSAREAISLLEKKLSEFESYYMTNTKNTQSSNDNLDDLINILENELTNPSEDKFNHPNQELRIKNMLGRQNKRRSLNSFRIRPDNDSDTYQSRKNVSVKLGVGNNLNTTNVLYKDNHKGDGVGGHKVITNVLSPERDALTKAAASAPKEHNNKIMPVTHHTTNVNYCLIPNYTRNEKKSKMFKLAGHKLQ